jgi:hypothetical protein
VKLINLYEKPNPDNIQAEPMIFTDAPNHEEINNTVRTTVRKRKREEPVTVKTEINEEEEPPSKKSWIYPKQSENDD